MTIFLIHKFKCAPERFDRIDAVEHNAHFVSGYNNGKLNLQIKFGSCENLRAVERVDHLRRGRNGKS